MNDLSLPGYPSAAQRLNLSTPERRFIFYLLLADTLLYSGLLFGTVSIVSFITHPITTSVAALIWGGLAAGSLLYSLRFLLKKEAENKGLFAFMLVKFLVIASGSILSLLVFVSAPIAAITVGTPLLFDAVLTNRALNFLIKMGQTSEVKTPFESDRPALSPDGPANF